MRLYLDTFRKEVFRCMLMLKKQGRLLLMIEWADSKFLAVVYLHNYLVVKTEQKNFGNTSKSFESAWFA